MCLLEKKIYGLYLVFNGNLYWWGDIYFFKIYGIDDVLKIDILVKYLWCKDDIDRNFGCVII